MNSYFQPYTHYFWEYSEGGEVIAVPEGSTIAYRGLLENTLNALSYQGLPRLGTIVLALAALSMDSKRLLQEIEVVLTELDENKEDNTQRNAMKFLNRLAEVPPEYKEGRMKETLLRAIFSDSHRRIGQKRARKQIYRKFKERKERKNFISPTKVNSTHVYEDIRPLDMLGLKFPTVKSILDEMAGIPELPEEIALPMVEDSQTHGKADEDLIEQLVQNNQTYEIGSLIRHLWSGLNIPFHSNTPSRRPFGGVSDITNKGDISRLLISEYAQEDIIFLTRLANSEALYLSRESPPAIADKQRDILIDITLKNWGTPKILAFACMLAIAHHPKSKMACRVFAVGQELIPVIHDQIKQVIKGVQLVDSSLNASPGIRQYFEENPPSRQTEVFLLTEMSTVKQAGILNLSQEIGAGINYWILSDQVGGIDVYRNSNRSRKHVQRLELPLTKLWEGQKKTTIPPPKELPKGKYPILIDTPINHKGVVYLNDFDTYLLVRNCLLKKRRISGRQTREIFNWEVIHDSLPIHGNIFQMGISKSGQLLILLWRQGKNTIHLVDLKSKEIRTIEFAVMNPGSSPEVVFENDRFLIKDPRSGEIWSINWQGSLTKESDDLNLFFREIRKKADRSLIRQRNKNVLAKLKSVAITTDSELVINNHKLVLNQQGKFKFRTNHGGKLLISALLIEDNYFQFENGTSVSMTVPGMITISAKDPNISSVYIPTALDQPIGLGSASDFTGEIQYYRSQIYWLTVDSVEDNKVAAVKAIKEIAQVGLKDAKTMVDSGAFTFERNFTSDELGKAREILDRARVVYDVVFEEDAFSELSIISPERFKKLYLEPLIQDVL